MQKMLEKTEELALARAWLEDGDERARSRLVRAYQPMIRAIARRHLRSGLDVEDLVQEGVIGFMGALDNFDPSLGYGVGTLARFHVAARIQLHVNEFAGVLRLPNSRKIKGLLTQCVSRIRIAELEKGAALTQAEKAGICRETGFDLAELEQYEMAMRPAKTIAPAQSPDSDESAFDIADESADVEAEVIARRSADKARSLLADILAGMPERTRTILQRRHLSEDFVSLDRIAEDLGISRERVRRIEIRALQEIRARLSEAGVASVADVA